MRLFTKKKTASHEECGFCNFGIVRLAEELDAVGVDETNCSPQNPEADAEDE